MFEKAEAKENPLLGRVLANFASLNKEYPERRKLHGVMEAFLVKSEAFANMVSTSLRWDNLKQFIDEFKDQAIDEWNQARFELGKGPCKLTTRSSEATVHYIQLGTRGVAPELAASLESGISIDSFVIQYNNLPESVRGIFPSFMNFGISMLADGGTFGNGPGGSGGCDESLGPKGGGNGGFGPRRDFVPIIAQPSTRVARRVR